MLRQSLILQILVLAIACNLYLTPSCKTVNYAKAHFNANHSNRPYFTHFSAINPLSSARLQGSNKSALPVRSTSKVSFLHIWWKTKTAPNSSSEFLYRKKTEAEKTEKFTDIYWCIPKMYILLPSKTAVHQVESSLMGHGCFSEWVAILFPSNVM